MDRNLYERYEGKAKVERAFCEPGSARDVELRGLAESEVGGWRAGSVKSPSPKELLQEDAVALRLDTSGTAAELTARIDAKAAELLAQAAELDIDADKLTAVELAAAVEAKLAE
ncbi:hypothetical protein [Actinokineospora globicatena]|uniref:Uncharacterized protein n=1 Tax=Actinokineospora globicatena TaxID=103729 RepID=A0A9W6QNR5_9PSEU|nr:hypothetical protein [Actinokineospora globicatena]GLW91783.1 hypothetical protein Aglo03_25990 [Actinokineospora globicatena]